MGLIFVDTHVNLSPIKKLSEHRIVPSSKSTVQVSFQNPQSEKAYMCFKTKRVRARNFTVHQIVEQQIVFC